MGKREDVRGDDVVAVEEEIEVQGEFSIPLAELREAHEAAIPALFA